MSASYATGHYQAMKQQDWTKTWRNRRRCDGFVWKGGRMAFFVRYNVRSGYYNGATQGERRHGGLRHLPAKHHCEKWPSRFSQKMMRNQGI